MALFKYYRGNRADLDAVSLHDGHAYFCVDDGSFHIDYLDGEGVLRRKQINANEADSIAGFSIVDAVADDAAVIPTGKAVYDAIADLTTEMSTNYDESIIGLSVDGQVITYIKGDGSTHTIVTQDTDTTYSLGTDTITGLTKLYATVGSAEDGTMTQKAIKTELDKKVSVSIDDTQGMLVFTI